MILIKKSVGLQKLMKYNSLRVFRTVPSFGLLTVFFFIGARRKLTIFDLSKIEISNHRDLIFLSALKLALTL